VVSHREPIEIVSPNPERDPDDTPVGKAGDIMGYAATPHLAPPTYPRVPFVSLKSDIR
jgi:hypothetical protein